MNASLKNALRIAEVSLTFKLALMSQDVRAAGRKSLGAPVSPSYHVHIEYGAAMRLFVKMVVVAAAVASVRSSGAPAWQQEREVLATSALLEAGVPLQRDPMGRVRWIEAGNGELTDESLRHVAGLPLLEWLEIGGGSVTPSGVARLKDCTEIRRLYLHDIRLGDEALSWVSGLAHLEALSLQKTGITGKVLRQVKAVDSLTVLNLGDNDIVDEDMEQIARFKGLEVLALQHTKVTGEGLARLKGMAKLNVLNLAHCVIGDGDLEHFTGMPNLRIVHAAGCRISDEAVKALDERLPMLSIFR